MDKDFLAQLDSKITNVGSDVVWKRTIGGRVIWLSPVSQTANMKITETMTNEELGIHMLTEVKRITISHSIAGIDDIDFREFDKFGPFDTKDGKQTYLTKDRYLYAKLATWGAQFIDNVFSVFSDLMQTYEKETLRNVTFENKKEPREELLELEARVRSLREEMGLPRLVEAQGDPTHQEIEDAKERESDLEKEIEKQTEQIVSNFNPFRPIEEPESLKIYPGTPKVVPSTSELPSKIEGMDPKISKRIEEIAKAENVSVQASPRVSQVVHNPIPSQISEVIEQKSQNRVDPKQVIIDAPPQGGKNPRFKSPAF